MRNWWLETAHENQSMTEIPIGHRLQLWPESRITGYLLEPCGIWWSTVLHRDELCTPGSLWQCGHSSFLVSDGALLCTAHSPLWCWSWRWHGSWGWQQWHQPVTLPVVAVWFEQPVPLTGYAGHPCGSPGDAVFAWSLKCLRSLSPWRRWTRWPLLSAAATNTRISTTWQRSVPQDSSLPAGLPGPLCPCAGYICWQDAIESLLSSHLQHVKESEWQIPV